MPFWFIVTLCLAIATCQPRCLCLSRSHTLAIACPSFVLILCWSPSDSLCNYPLQGSVLFWPLVFTHRQRPSVCLKVSPWLHGLCYCRSVSLTNALSPIKFKMLRHLNIESLNIYVPHCRSTYWRESVNVCCRIWLRLRFKPRAILRGTMHLEARLVNANALEITIPGCSTSWRIVHLV